MTLGAVLLLVVLAARAAVAGTSSIPVLVVETPTTVELRIRLIERMDPSSVELELAGRTVTIHARDAATGERAYQRRLTLHQPVIEERAAAEYDGGKWLTIVLRKPP